MTDFFLRNGRDFHKEMDTIEDLPRRSSTAMTVSLYVSDINHAKCTRIRPANATHYAYYNVSGIVPNNKYAFEMAYKNVLTQGITVKVLNKVASNATIFRASVFGTTWRNYLKYCTAPAACSVVQIRFMRAKGTFNTAMFVDDVKFQGNALFQDPDDYDFIIDDSTFDHELGNANIVRDRLAINAKFRMGFPLATNATYRRILDFVKSRSGEQGYFSDTMIPVITEVAVLRTSSSFTFSGVTTGHNLHNAYRSQTSMDTPTTQLVCQQTEFTNTKYAQVAASAANYATCAVTQTGKYGFHKFVFKCTKYASVGHIRKFSARWAGSCDDGSIKNVDGVNFYAWDGKNWALLDISRSADDETLAFSSSNKEIAQQFVVVASSLVRLMVRTRGAKQATGALTLKSKFVGVAVNDKLLNQVSLRGKAEPTASGALVSVKTVLSDVAISLNGVTAGYRLTDDRRGVAIWGVSSGRQVMVKYKAQYEVVHNGFNVNRDYPTHREIALGLKTITPFED